MINPEKRKAIFALHQEGMSVREIARRLQASRNTIRSIIKQSGNMPVATRTDKVDIDRELLGSLYVECNGWIQRIHEKLVEEKGIDVGYSTLTRMIRELGLDGSTGKRCARVADEPGAEMQHDTSPYTLEVSNQRIRVVGSLLYFRYSKIRYLKFYRSFTRFKMQCFFHEALMHWGFSAPVCIIDNTNLARLRGTGANALIVPEMEEFGRRYGFRFVCHAINHPNRKAGNERSFWTVETNFFPGRSFASEEDLNHQALQWSTVRMANRPVSKSGLLPAKAFEHEQLYLVRIPPAVESPYLAHTRGTDQYGYAAFDGNYFWVPGVSRAEVTILQYAQCLKMYRKRELLAEYKLPADGIKNQLFSPQGLPAPPHKPRSRKKPTDQEEKRLRAISPQVDAYLNFALQPKGITKHRFIRQLYALSCKVAPSLFARTLERALKYRIIDMQTIERISLLYLSAGDHEIPSVGRIDEDLENREAYQEGRLSEEVDLSKYGKMFEEDDDNG
jgi:transposase